MTKICLWLDEVVEDQNKSLLEIRIIGRVDRLIVEIYDDINGLIVVLMNPWNREVARSDRVELVVDFDAMRRNSVEVMLNIDDEWVLRVEFCF